MLLTPTRPLPPSAGHTPAQQARYGRKKQREAARQRLQSHEEREIGPMPHVENPRRRSAAIKFLKKFCLTYLKARFSKPFGKAQLRVITEFERIIKHGGLLALAMPRASGKTALAVAAVLWAILCHGHRFVMLIAANLSMAKKLLAQVAVIVQKNKVLRADFPEFIYPIAVKNGINQSRPLFNGEPVEAKILKTEIVFASIEGHCAGAVVQCAGLLSGNIRGQSYTLPSGEMLRPSLFIADDPQTRASAKSKGQTADRLAILAGDVEGTVGPGEEMSGIVPCTVIRNGDLADSLLDPAKNPHYQGLRFKMIEGLPADKDNKPWWEYKKVYDEGMRMRDNGAACRKYFRLHVKKLSRGLTEYWPARYKKGEVNAVHHALNLWCKNREAFHAEAQNDPSAALMAEGNTPIMTGLFAKFTRRPRRIAPTWARKLVAYIDVSKEVLFYCVLAYGEGFRCAILDYGTFPDQGPEYFTKDNLRSKLSEDFAAAGNVGGMESWIVWGLNRLFPKLNGPWSRDDGHELRIEKIGIDTGWGDSTDFLYEYCRASTVGSILIPCKGVGVTAGKKPMTEWTTKDNEPPPGFHWIVSTEPSKRAVWLLRYDTNFWKTFTCTRAAAAPGPGSLFLFGDETGTHQVLNDHCHLETPVYTAGRDRVVWEWKAPPNANNDKFDCVVGCVMLASFTGASLLEQYQVAPPRTWSAAEIAAARARNQQ